VIKQHVLWKILHAMTEEEILRLMRRLERENEKEAVFVLLKHLEERRELGKN